MRKVFELGFLLFVSFVSIFLQEVVYEFPNSLERM